MSAYFGVIGNGAISSVGNDKVPLCLVAEEIGFSLILVPENNRFFLFVWGEMGVCLFI